MSGGRGEESDGDELVAKWNFLKSRQSARGEVCFAGKVEVLF